MSISHSKPANELVHFGDAMGRPIEDSFTWPLVLPTQWTGIRMIPLFVFDEGNNLVVKAVFPGIKPEDLYIDVRENALNIAGEIKREKDGKKENFFLNERRYGQFRRSVALPYRVEIDRVLAEFRDGILILTLPKAKTTKGKKIS